MSDKHTKRLLGSIAMAIVVFLLLMTLPPPAEAQPAPPAFSSNIDTVFPGAPFVTCLQGQFETPQPPPGSPTPPPHFWFIRARQSGTLTIDVRGFSVNSAETGSIIATLFDGTTLLSSVEVPQPTVAGTENIGFMTVSVQTPKIYRLEVARGPHDPTIPEAHHYKLSFSNVLVDVGINSPSFRYLEPETQVFQVNLGSSETLDLQLTTDFAPPPGQTLQLTVEVSRRDSFPTVLTTLSGNLPLSLNLASPFGSAPGTLVLKVGGNTHYIMDKVSGSDRGIYYDTCPPPPPPPPPSIPTPKTIGYWKNHEQETESKLPVPLGNYLVDTLAKAKAVLDTAHMKNAHDMLAAQFLAARLNVLSGVPSACVNAAMNDPYPTGATGILVYAGYMGPGTTASPSDKAAVNAVKDALDNFNNKGCP